MKIGGVRVKPDAAARFIYLTEVLGRYRGWSRRVTRNHGYAKREIQNQLYYDQDRPDHHDISETETT